MKYFLIRGFASVPLLIGLLIILAGAGYWYWSSDANMPGNEPASVSQGFPYTVKDGQVYCALDSVRIGGAQVEGADTTTFRRPTQEEYDAAVAIRSIFMIDAIDKNNSYYQCGRVNFSGTE